MNTSDDKIHVLAQKCFQQIGQIDTSATIKGLSSRMQSVKKFMKKFSEEATTETNNMLAAYSENRSEAEVEAYRNQLVKAVRDQIEVYSKRILG